MEQKLLIQGFKEEIEILALLKQIFWTEPTKNLFKNLQVIPAISGETKIDKGLNLLSGVVVENKNRQDAYLEDLAIEYARLFIGPQKPAAVPYASFYLTESKTMMSEVTTDVRKKYLDAGIAVKDLYKLPDDHIAIELEFLQYLVQRIIKLFDDGKHNEEALKLFEMREKFLNEHFEKWVPLFEENIVKAAPDKFYLGASLLLGGYVSTL